MKTILLISLLAMLTTCGGGQKQEQSSEQTDKQLTTPVEKQFYTGGLKYETTIQIIIESDGKLTGTVTSNEYGMENEAETVSFSGTQTDGKINVKFNGEPPIVGDASEWTDKPWQIVKKDGEEMLVIIFNSKNYETDEWEETEWEFENIK